MVLQDRGLDIKRTNIGSGLSSFQVDRPNNLASQISNVAPDVEWHSGHATELNDALDVLNRPNGCSLIAELRAGNINHAVVVDGVTPSGAIKIRDPWDQTTYTIERSDFLESWTGGFIGQ